VLTLAIAELLSPYDATYLELTIRRGRPLASSEAALHRATARHGIPVVPDGPAKSEPTVNASYGMRSALLVRRLQFS
jgi:hypothetical protein